MNDHVEDAIIRPMLRAYQPPGYLKADRERAEAVLDIYRESLARFARPVLEQAWRRAAEQNGFWCWPTCDDIVKAAEHFHALAHPKIKPDDSWVEKATALADAYTRKFMKTSAVAVRSREGRYEAELRQYVTEVSWVQAQYILGRKDIAYRSTTLFGREKPDDEFFARAREQAETGSIRVRVPLALVERWREGAEKGRSR
jgi:hypothetical protein